MVKKLMTEATMSTARSFTVSPATSYSPPISDCQPLSWDSASAMLLVGSADLSIATARYA